MAKVIGTIAGAVALVATGLGALGVAGIAGIGSMSAIAGVASVAAAASNIGASLLQKPPPARGSVTQVLIAPDAPTPYMMGEGYFAGVLRHDVAYGATLNKVPNPYRWMVTVYSGGGPVQSIAPYVDKAAVGAYYSGFLDTDTQLGACPEAAALVPPFGAATGWDASSKLSGQAAIGWNLKFDKEGKRFASGVPQLGAYGQWVKVYDPRLDSTFPGGSGAHRVDDEDTWEWSENPALHFGTYAYGRYQNGKRTFGVGEPYEAIAWATIAAWANVCEANDWTIFGVIYEPGNRWANLKDIAAAGGAQPVASSGGLLSVKYAAPQVALDTIAPEDLADDPARITAMQSWGERVNTIVPKYTSPAHEWQQVAAEPVVVSSYVTEDGEEKVREWPFNLVKQVDQVTQLAAYVLVDGREITPIVLHCGPRLRAYRPGECLTLDLPDYGLETDAIILQRQFDPATMTVTLTLVGETAAKHAYALGLTGTAPPTPSLGQTGEERDEVIAGVGTNAPEVVADEAALVALAVPAGTVAVRSDNGISYIRNEGTAGDITDWTPVGTVTTAYTDEMARDAIGAALVEGAGIDITVDDGANTITIAATGSTYTDEMARDAIGTALVAGSNVAVTVNDGADTITIAANGAGFHGLMPVPSGVGITPAATGTASVNTAGVADRLDFVPFIPGRTYTIDRLTIRVITGVASTKARLGIYADNNGVPGALIVDGGEVNTDATANVFVSVSQTLTAGTPYWLAILYQGTPTIRHVPVASALAIQAPASGNDPTIYRATQAYGALPNPAPAATATNANVPSILPRVA